MKSFRAVLTFASGMLTVHFLLCLVRCVEKGWPVLAVLSVIGLLCSLLLAWRVIKGPRSDKNCDECGETIPDKDGGEHANKHHADSCSLYDPNND